MPVFIPMSKKGKAKECSKMKVMSLSCVQLFATPWTITYQTPLFMGFSKQEYWNGFPFPSPGDFPDPGLKPRSPALQADSLQPEPPEKLRILFILHMYNCLPEVLVTQSCPTLCNSMDYSPPGSSVHGIFQARILEWVAISFSRGSS